VDRRVRRRRCAPRRMGDVCPARVGGTSWVPPVRHRARRRLRGRGSDRVGPRVRPAARCAGAGHPARGRGRTEVPGSTRRTRGVGGDGVRRRVRGIPGIRSAAHDDRAAGAFGRSAGEPRRWTGVAGRPGGGRLVVRLVRLRLRARVRSPSVPAAHLTSQDLCRPVWRARRRRRRLGARPRGAWAVAAGRRPGRAPPWHRRTGR